MQYYKNKQERKSKYFVLNLSLLTPTCGLFEFHPHWSTFLYFERLLFNVLSQTPITKAQYKCALQKKKKETYVDSTFNQSSKN